MGQGTLATVSASPRAAADSRRLAKTQAENVKQKEECEPPNVFLTSPSIPSSAVDDNHAAQHQEELDAVRSDFEKARARIAELEKTETPKEGAGSGGGASSSSNVPVSIRHLMDQLAMAQEAARKAGEETARTRKEAALIAVQRDDLIASRASHRKGRFHLDNDKMEYGQMEVALAKKQVETQMLLSERDDLQSRISILETERSSLARTIKDLKQSRTEENKDVEEMKKKAVKKYKVAQDRIKELEGKVEMLVKAGEKGGAAELEQELTSHLATLTDEHNDLLSRFSTLEATLSILRTNTLLSARSMVEALEGQKTDAQDKLEAKAREVKAVETRLAEVQRVKKRSGTSDVEARLRRGTEDRKQLELKLTSLTSKHSTLSIRFSTLEAAHQKLLSSPHHAAALQPSSSSSSAAAEPPQQTFAHALSGSALDEAEQRIVRLEKEKREEGEKVRELEVKLSGFLEGMVREWELEEMLRKLEGKTRECEAAIAQLDALAVKHDDFRFRCSSLQASSSPLSAPRSSDSADVDSLTKEIEELKESLRNAGEMIEKLDKQVGEEKGNVEELEKKMAEQVVEEQKTVKELEERVGVAERRIVAESLETERKAKEKMEEHELNSTKSQLDKLQNRFFWLKVNHDKLINQHDLLRSYRKSESGKLTRTICDLETRAQEDETKLAELEKGRKEEADKVKQLKKELGEQEERYERTVEALEKELEVAKVRETEREEQSVRIGESSTTSPSTHPSSAFSSSPPSASDNDNEHAEFVALLQQVEKAQTTLVRKDGAIKQLLGQVRALNRQVGEKTEENAELIFRLSQQE
ncbi:hypothetical protein JCM8547_003870 [Rhodosporidiobolus lusitaniae]